MSNIIKLLPDSVANQIAAGEVVQRPASVVKELMENSVDAGAQSIQVVIKESGRTLIQIIDNGSGMSEIDARMAFERHATSKISQADDLFHIRTKGFRGEALASIAAVAQVELKTRRRNDELGIHLIIGASQVEEQTPIQCAVGSNFMVKNLFYNIPARRKFLKQNSTEFRHVLNEFERVALAHSEVEFSLTHNDTTIYTLPSGNLRQRIVNLIGKQINQQLLPIQAETPLVTINGFIGKPESARKTLGTQFFFVNNRYIRHPYLHKALMEAYSNLISSDSIPSYFIFIEIDPQLIDINIHPTKTEIKFEDERTIWHILNASIRESLGKFNIVPSIDFDMEGMPDIPLPLRTGGIDEPSISINPTYNPFDPSSSASNHHQHNPTVHLSSQGGWEDLYNGFENETPDRNEAISTESSGFHFTIQSEPEQQTFLSSNDVAPITGGSFFQFKGRYILSSVKSGLMFIDQKRAHEQVLFEKFLGQMESRQQISQKQLFPQVLTFGGEDALLLRDLLEELECAGIAIEENEDGDFEVLSLPIDLLNANIAHVVEAILESYKTGEYNAEQELKKRIAATMAANAAIKYGHPLSVIEMQELFDNLFACQSPNYSFAGKTIICIIENDSIEQLFGS